MEAFSGFVILCTLVAGLAVPVGVFLLLAGLFSQSARLKKFSLRLLLVLGIVLMVSFTLCSTGVVKV